MNVHAGVATPRISPLLAIAIEKLATCVAGRIITADAPDYDEVRDLAHSNWDRRPLFVARAANAADVAEVVDFARRHQIELAVRSGGHSVCGHSASQDGVVIDLRDLDSLDIDLQNMTLWAGTGLTAGQVTQALDPHGVVIGFGDSATVGIGGITLGGGMGYLTRKFGLTMDALLAAEIVTPDGSILTIDETAYPDLFWAIRGGGGNFGVVTRLCYRLNPLPDFVGGPLVLPATPEVLAGFVAAAKAAPDALGSIMLAMPAPPLPFLPPALVGQTVLIGMMGFAGPAAEAELALAPFRALAEPLADLVRPGPYSMMYLPEDPAAKPALAIRSQFLENLDVNDARIILETIAGCQAPMCMAQIRVLGGAAGRIASHATAYAHRDAALLVGFLAMDGGAEAAARHTEWAAGGVAALGGAMRGTYVNFLGEQGTDMLARCYGDATWQRLRAVKRRYDPDNLFRLNQNIPPG